MRVLGWIEDLAADLIAIGADAPPAPRWDQDWFPRLDAAAAYAIVRLTRPARIVEVGSGHSTRFLARAVRDGCLRTQITAIDPAPRASIAGLEVHSLPEPVQRCDVGLFQSLAPGDILFVDSSHQFKPGSDVEFIFDRVLPRLGSGVRIHFHDIFLPDEYPAQWAWRRYNEQAAVAALIGDDYAPEFSSHQAATGGGLNGVLGRLPLVPGAMETSLWLRKR
jgi:methyltransferase family protein